MKHFQLIFILIISFFATELVAQRTITGTVTDGKGEALIGASVLVPGTSMGTVTDLDGNFSIVVMDNIKTLVITYIGYNTGEISIEGLTTINISLGGEPDSAQLWTRANARVATEKAMDLAEKGDFDESIAYLDEQINSVSTNGDLISYRGYFLFVKGYMYHFRSQGANEESLIKAKSLYEESLRFKPGDLQIINNLIIVSRKLKHWNSAEKYVKMALKSDSKNAEKWQSLLGNIYESKKEYQSAWKQYSILLQDEYQERETAKKIVSMYPHLGDWDSKILLKKCLEIDGRGMSEIALQGIEHIIKIQCTSKSEIDEEVMLSWSKILVQNNWVKSKFQSHIKPLNCIKVPLNSIISFTDWRLDLPANDWWKLNGRRYFYYQALQKGWADGLLSEGEVDKAAKLYQACRKNLKHMSDYSMEIFETTGALEMDVLIQLAQLYGSSEKFASLEKELFNQKGEAYRSNDLERILKYHTILGYIYLDRNQWEGPWAKNAEFQLRRAVETAEDIAIEAPSKYAPKPHLYQLLAITYEKRDNPREATKAYQNAAIGYMETDHLELGRQMSGKAQTFLANVQSGQIAEKQIDIVSILNARQNTVALSKTSFDKSGSDYFRKEKEYSWLENPNNIKYIDPAIVERQKFKVLADLESQARKTGATESAKELEKEAKDAGDNVQVLSSYQDLIRLKQVDKSKQLINSKSLKSKSLDYDLKGKNEKILPNKLIKTKKVMKKGKSGRG